MKKELTLVIAAFAMTATGIVAATPADAQRYGAREDRAYAYDQAYRDGYNRDDGYRNDRSYRDGNYRDGGYRNDRRYDRRSYRNRDRCRTGDTGTVIGAIAGGLLGNSVAGRGDRTLGAVLGAGAGALAGRAVERNDRPGYCR